MVVLKIDPFGEMRKGSHIWRGARAVLWYYETMDDSFRLIVLYAFGDKKRRLTLEIDNKNSRVESKNDELDDALYEHLLGEIEMMEKLTREPEKEK